MFQQEIKGNLARLLATENLVVEHRDVPTAQFDVDRRVLTLPNWDKASSIVYDMLVGHEVGHALFTPNEDWTLKVNVPQSYVNVVEDVRIEKLMKRKYPGIRKSFNGGYGELNALDFFEVKGEDLSKFALIDRINLHFKVGADAMVPFTEDEKEFVTRSENTETFDEVLTLADDIRKFVKAQKEIQEALEAHLNANTSNDSNSDNEEGNTFQKVDEPSSKMSDEQIEEEFNRDNPDFENLEEDDDLSGGNQGGEHWEGETQENFDRKTEALSDTNHGREVTYVEIPDTVDTSKFIVDWRVVHKWIEEQKYEDEREVIHTWDNRRTCADVDSLYKEFRDTNKKEVNYLVKEFECRKSADAYARTSTAKTGMLNMTKLHTYKYNEDLFKRVSIVPDGKNHGMIFILDWSGSMHHELLPTVKQLLNLTAFCKKVQIPFEVYAFTNEWQKAQRALDGGELDTSTSWYGHNYREYTNIEKNKVFLGQGEFHLVNFVSSRSNPREYETQCRNLFREAYYYADRHITYRSTLGLELSGTPLNEAIVMLNYILPEFKKNNSLQKVNVCILTDGESNSISYGCTSTYEEDDKVFPRSLDYGNCALRDRKTGRLYPKMEYNQATETFIKQVCDRFPDVNVLGFRILPSSRLSEFVARFGCYSRYEEVQKQWRKDKSAIVPDPKGYTALYAISSKNLEDENNFEVSENAKKGEITRAFKKMLKNKSTNKKLLNSFVSHVA